MREYLSVLVMEIKLLIVGMLYKRNRHDLTWRQYAEWVRKPMRKLWQTKNAVFYHHGKAMLEVKATDVADHLKLSQDPTDPVLIVVVKNDLLRMKLLFAYYRALGVHQFVVLDNGSDDGTREFCAQQQDVLVVRVDNPYITIRKEGWVEYAISRIGTERWYIVVDADEMLDYPGSENHSVQDLIRAQERLGNKRLYGYLLDMYDEQPLYATACEAEEIPEKFLWFDTDTYTWDTALYDVQIIRGGPRERLLGRKTWASKCPVYFYSRDMTVINAHFQHPFEDIREKELHVVLKHYKYLSSDRKLYQERATEAAGYGPTADTYAAANALSEQDKNATLWYEGSVKYESSESLLQLKHMTRTPMK